MLKEQFLEALENEDYDTLVKIIDQDKSMIADYCFTALQQIIQLSSQLPVTEHLILATKLIDITILGGCDDYDALKERIDALFEELGDSRAILNFALIVISTAQRLKRACQQVSTVMSFSLN